MSGISQTDDDSHNLLSCLQDRIEDLSRWRQGISAWKNTTNTRLEQLEVENEELRERVDRLETVAEQAMVVASSGHDIKTESKVERAKRLTRNELIRRAATDVSASDRPITVATVQEMAKPETNLAYQTVKDSWEDLRTQWPCFRLTLKKGSKAMTVSKKDITKALARAVEVDLERDDITKGLISSEEGKGDHNESDRTRNTTPLVDQENSVSVFVLESFC